MNRKPLDNFFNIGGEPLEIISTETRKMNASKEGILYHGSDNKLDQRLMKLFKNVPVLRAFVEGSSLLSSQLFTSDLSLDFNDLFMKLYLYGTAYLFVRQSRDHKSFYITVLDNRHVRTNADKSMFAYSELEGFRKYSVYPAFNGTDGQSIIMINLNQLEAPYALPLWSSALREVQILDQVAGYHNASLKNGFNPSALINFNNGTPSPEDKDEIERLIENKFCSADNANKIMVSFNDSKENAAEVLPINIEDRSQRYLDLIKHCESVLGQSFHGSPILFGSNDESAEALTETEFGWRFSLFVKFTIAPIAKIVHNNLKMFGVAMSDPMSLVNTMRIVSEGE